jgi:hypothetical protein
VYRGKIAEALADGRLSTDERATLRLVGESLGVPASRADEMLDEEINKLLVFAFNAAVADKRWSEDEEQQFSSLAAHFGVTVTHPDATKSLLQRYRMLWHIDSGRLPEHDVDVHLPRGEVCHATADASRHEYRVVTRGYNYGGLRARGAIVKGLSWHIGSMSVDRVRHDVLTQIDTGTVYLTNRRLLFDGEKQNSTVPLSKITRFTAYTDGLQVEKATGRDQWYIGRVADWELLATCLDSLLRRLNQ